MNTTALLAMFVLVAIGDALRCYQGCGKSSVAGVEVKTPCDTGKEIDCPSGQVCSTQTYSYGIGSLGFEVKYEITSELCAEKSENTDALCDDLEAKITDGTPLKFSCEINFCETALCNSGFTAHVSFLVLSAGVLVFGLF